jgi:hypothetical protein
VFQSRESIPEVELKCDIKIEPLGPAEIFKSEEDSSDPTWQKPPPSKRRKQPLVAKVEWVKPEDTSEQLSTPIAAEIVETLMTENDPCDTFEENDDSSVNEEKVQCYYCSEMVPKTKAKDHQVRKHGRFSSRMVGEKRPYKCHLCNASLQRLLLDTPNHICHIGIEPYIQVCC